MSEYYLPEGYAMIEKDGLWIATAYEIESEERMSDFEKRWGKLTVGEALELNKKAVESMGDPSIEE